MPRSTLYPPPPSLPQGICYVKVGVQRNWKQLLLKLIPNQLGEKCGIYLFILVTYKFTSYTRNTHEKKFHTSKRPTRKNFGPAKYPREKILGPRTDHKRNFCTHEISTRKSFGATKNLWEKLLDSRSTMTRWHEAHETYNGTWPTIVFFVKIHFC